MRRRFCDICKEEGTYKDIDICEGYEMSSEGSCGKEEFKSFERPIVTKMDLCKKHYKIWCRATYECFWGKVKE